MLDALAGAERVRDLPVEPDRLHRAAPRRARRARDAVSRPADDAVAVSPIVAGAALKGPADRLLAELGHEASVVGVARLYAPLARHPGGRRGRRRTWPGGRGRGDAVRRRAHGHARAGRGGRRSRRESSLEHARSACIEIIPVEGVPEVRPGDVLADLIADARRRCATATCWW